MDISIYGSEEKILIADTIYGEARGEIVEFGSDAAIAIANVIMNRYAKSPKYGETIKEICLRPFQFSCWLPNNPNLAVMKSCERFNTYEYQICLSVADEAEKGGLKDIIRGSNHYHAYGITPKWALGRTPTARIGRHIFYYIA
ncbi:cell wall hydrolase [Candidatus Hydrogenosomobacter endosymbioticus]|uniref:Cell wall hydrolase SleB domain-containing protein n=1 Tax=Candidatus Hydrogenosomobacter endosymbioticus TaxID=2558174 RepID=A0ABM7V827_9PROT|nr:cell wall hydrolase [Candidatus Hydrogenosomobacter endosymbioticus]BDB95921.1 hypothetical protein HYD_0540 [Candidatus Hydrogenosomobacter endosymbioticus]